MKIYIVGAHSCGKTTLARYISETHALPILPEVARMVLAEKELNLNSLRTDLKLVNDYQQQIFYRQIKEEEKYSDFVSDRSFDCLAYAAQHSQIVHKLFASKELSDYLDKLKQKDVIIFFVRPSKITMKEDGTRETLNWDGIIAIDAMVKLLIKLWNLNHIQLNMDSMQERIQLIDTIINQYK